eukprot:977054-Rhodomonas_salina.1
MCEGSLTHLCARAPPFPPVALAAAALAFKEACRPHCKHLRVWSGVDVWRRVCSRRPRINASVAHNHVQSRPHEWEQSI